MHFYFAHYRNCKINMLYSTVSAFLLKKNHRICPCLKKKFSTFLLFYKIERGPYVWSNQLRFQESQTSHVFQTCSWYVPTTGLLECERGSVVELIHSDTNIA